MRITQSKALDYVESILTDKGFTMTSKDISQVTRAFNFKIPEIIERDNLMIWVDRLYLAWSYDNSMRVNYTYITGKYVVDSIALLNLSLGLTSITKQRRAVLEHDKLMLEIALRMMYDQNIRMLFNYVV